MSVHWGVPTSVCVHCNGCGCVSKVDVSCICGLTVVSAPCVLLPNLCTVCTCIHAYIRTYVRMYESAFYKMTDTANFAVESIHIYVHACIHMCTLKKLDCCIVGVHML